MDRRHPHILQFNPSYESRIAEKEQPCAGSSLANPAALNSPITTSLFLLATNGRDERAMANCLRIFKRCRTIRLFTGGEKRSARDGIAPPAGKFQRGWSWETDVGLASSTAPAREPTAQSLQAAFR
jgi:hypothetical protein